jgi:hypothetical protein
MKTPCKRTPEPEDMKTLAWAGVMGHRWAVTVKRGDQDRGPARAVVYEFDDGDIERALRYYGPEREPRVFQRVQRGTRARHWQRVR